MILEVEINTIKRHYTPLSSISVHNSGMIRSCVIQEHPGTNVVLHMIVFSSSYGPRSYL